jgi:hypothetical protein
VRVEAACPFLADARCRAATQVRDALQNATAALPEPRKQESAKV